VSSFLRVLALAALPALGNLSGVVLAIVGVVLMPRALATNLGVHLPEVSQPVDAALQRKI
jgi:hypothetical protein